MPPILIKSNGLASKCDVMLEVRTSIMIDTSFDNQISLEMDLPICYEFAKMCE
jgi:hypothetical protein